MKAKITLPDLKQLATRVRNLPALLQPGRRMLAVEIAGKWILAAVAEARGRKLSVRNFVALERSNAGDDLPDPVNLKEIMERLDYRTGPVVLVSPLARSVQITMNRAKVNRLRQYQLCDALRWEVEPYTGISGTQAIIGAEKGHQVEHEDLMLLTEEEEEVDVNVSVIEQNVYRAMKQIFRRSGLKLARMYPPEVCFYMPLFQDPPDSAQAVFDIGADYANFTIVKGRQPKQINTYPLGRDVLLEMIEGGDSAEAETSLDFLLKQVPGPLPLLLTGIGATLPRVTAFLNERCEYGAEALVLSRSDKLAAASHESLNAMYAITAGAALRELSGASWRLIGITDAIPLPVRIRQSGHVVPIAVALVLAGGLFAHYGYMKNSRERYQAQTAELQTQVQERQKQQEAFDKLRKQEEELRQEINRFRRQLAFLQGGSDDNLIHINQVLRAFFELPAQMRLESIRQADMKFFLQGSGDDFAVIGAFAVALQQYPWCQAVNIKVLEDRGEGSLHFQIEIETFSGDAPPAVVVEEAPAQKRSRRTRR